MAFLSDKAVGDIVKIKENNVAVNYIIVHKGKPSTLYDSSCDGVWLLREQAHSKMAWEADNKNDYENSDMKTWLNETFLNTIDSKIREAIKTVKIPFKKGLGNASTPVQSGANGLPCKVFLLSGYEVGFTTTDNQYFPVDGAKLSYFLNGNSDANAKTKRICKDSTNTAVVWWLRSPNTNDGSRAFSVNTDGAFSNYRAYSTGYAARPAFILPSSLLVDSNGNVSTNTLPTITSDKTGNLGTLESGFTCKYSVDDKDAADSVTVTLSMDSTTIKTFTATKKKQETYSLAGNDWLKTTNGSHTFKISASDGKDTATSTATFTRNCNKLTVTLAEPLVADASNTENARISACSLAIAGSIPSDAVVVYEVTNNANDPEPVWEDCSVKAKAGFSYVFNNKTAANGFAFNFRITVQRGASNAGGYITKITGGFQ